MWLEHVLHERVVVHTCSLWQELQSIPTRCSWHKPSACVSAENGRLVLLCRRCLRAHRNVGDGLQLRGPSLDLMRFFVVVIGSGHGATRARRKGSQIRLHGARTE